VVLGDQRGRTLGFPTANVAVSPEQAVPADGVYAGWALLQGEPAIGSDSSHSWHDRHGLNPLTPVENVAADRLPAKRYNGSTTGQKGMVDARHRAVINIGTRPTFGNGPRTIEAHLLDFEDHIYGQQLVLDFVRRLRPEQRFNDIETLRAQIHRDVEQARQLLHRA
jgi:riboflavin kinase/FMN adenylyltransferase